MRAKITLLQALLGLAGLAFGAPGRAQCPNPEALETREDCPWAGTARSLEGIEDPKTIRATLEKSIPGFLRQLERDQKTPGLLSLWGLSRNIDESNLATGTKTVPANLLQFFNRTLKVPFDETYTTGHAGLTHTYGYLFSTVRTPYGYKRARYGKHEIEAGFGLSEGLLGGMPKKGTLLLNLSLLAGRIAFRDSNEGMKKMSDLARKSAHRAPRELLKFDFASLKPRRLIEQITAEDETIEIRTDIVPFLKDNPHGKNKAILIYSILTQRKNAPPESPALITVFPVEESFAGTLFKPEGLGESVPIKLRYNAVLPKSLPAEKMVGKRWVTHEIE